MLALLHYQAVALHILADYEPAFARAKVLAANAQAAALTQSVIHQPVVPAQHAPGQIDDIARLSGQKIHKELLEIPFADEAHAGGILFHCGGKAGFPCDIAHLGFIEMTNGKEHPFKLIGAQPRKEIGLILVQILRAQQLEPPLRAELCVMPGRKAVGLHAEGEFEERLELDLGIAEYVGIGGAQLFVFVKEIREYPIHVFPGKIHGVAGYAYRVRHAKRVLPVSRGGAHSVWVLFLPVLHENAHDVKALLLQKQSRDGRIHAAGKPDDDPL